MDFFGIRHNAKKENAIQINEVSQQQWYYTPFTFFNKDKKDKPLGNIYFQAVMNLIWKGISNITFVKNGKPSFVVEGITDFIDANATLLVNQYIRLGYICVFYDKNGEYRLPQDNEIKIDNYGRVINKYAVVIYSPQYQTERLSLFKIAFPMVLWINKLAGSEDYLADTFGCFGILSGKDIPLSPAGKEQLLKSMQENYGIADGKYPFMLTQNEMTWTQVQPDIDALSFQEKIDRAYKVLCNLFGVPTQLLFDDNSTYNNIQESRIFFYDTTIRYYAEILLKVAQELLTASNEFIPKDSLNYKLENIPELEKTLSAACDERVALLDLLIKLKESGQDVEKALSELTQDTEKLLKRI